MSQILESQIASRPADAADEHFQRGRVGVEFLGIVAERGIENAALAPHFGPRDRHDTAATFVGVDCFRQDRVGRIDQHVILLGVIGELQGKAVGDRALVRGEADCVVADVRVGDKMTANHPFVVDVAAEGVPGAAVEASQGDSAVHGGGQVFGLFGSEFSHGPVRNDQVVGFEGFGVVEAGQGVENLRFDVVRGEFGLQAEGDGFGLVAVPTSPKIECAFHGFLDESRKWLVGLGWGFCGRTGDIHPRPGCRGSRSAAGDRLRMWDRRGPQPGNPKCLGACGRLSGKAVVGVLLLFGL